MKKIISLLLLLSIVCCLFSACVESIGDEYEVVTVAKYTVRTGASDNGPIETERLCFVYQNPNGELVLVENFRVDSFYGNYVLIGDTNKYVDISSIREAHRYLYLTEEIYNELFPNGLPED